MNDIAVTNPQIISQMTTNLGENLQEFSKKHTVMLVFLRHFGCVFCKTAMIDIAKNRDEIERRGVKIVFVHMTDMPTAEKYFKQFDLDGVRFVNDPEKKYYTGFGLFRGSFTQLFGLQTWIKGYSVIKEHNLPISDGKNLGDSFQMPGVFFIQNGIVVEKYVHQNASDRPNYFKLAECCMI